MVASQQILHPLTLHPTAIHQVAIYMVAGHYNFATLQLVIDKSFGLLGQRMPRQR